MELSRLNKLVCRSVFPGQMIYVRDGDAEDYTGVMTESMEALHVKEEKEETALKRLSALDEGDDDLVEVPRLCSDIVENFVNSTMAMLKVLYITDGKGMVPGVLEANVDYVRFTPDPGMIVNEYGAAEYTLHFEHLDLLQPITQSEVPDLGDSHINIGPGGAHHHSYTPTGNADEDDLGMVNAAGLPPCFSIS